MKEKPEKKPTPDGNGNNGKRCWQLYSLQRLSTDKFIDVVERILKGEYELLNSVSEIYKEQ
ncbi:MAG: hypothetical protein WBD28_02975 [Candidatus Zixiibacteriota bacterium]